MKLIIVGATGFVGKEVLRQSLLRKDVTSVVAVTRRALTLSSSSPKLQNVVVVDYDQYNEEAKTAFKGANGCIWTIAITPSKSSTHPWDEVVRVCQTSTLVGLRTMYEAGLGTPFRFVYMSGIAAERDQSKTPSFRPQYSLMRGATETQVLEYAGEKGFEAVVAKPGLISDGSIMKKAFSTALYYTMSVPSITVEQCTVAMLEQVVCGVEKEPMLNDDLVKVAERMKKDGRML